MEKLYVTREGLEKLLRDLRERQARSAELSEELEHARSYGDFRENAEYDAGKEAQAKLQAQIRDLEEKIAQASVVDGSQIDTSKAYLGATVRVHNKKLNKEFTYTLVSPVEADMDSGKISIRSPVGQALVGRSRGETVIAKAPAGELELEILEIRW